MSDETPTAFDRTIRQWSFDNAVRFEWMLPLAASNETDSCCEILRNFIEDNADEYLARVFGNGFAEFAKAAERECKKYEEEWDGRERLWQVLDWINNRLPPSAFIVCIQQPVRTPLGDSGSSSYSWGYCHIRHIVAPTIADVLPLVTEESKRMMDGDMNPKPKKKSRKRALKRVPKPAASEPLKG